ncbi:formylglycine-generating enzyme required for sulfatase activity [Actinomadura pelletieri DSM 43383]|uniref:Formylglycine-generating enzyme required for sulfatase activity n=1 Tax=Actinomadura pelletieri DSM 43383 TaxID=1120940 RepID=A0A495QKR6_9ACTN|nr:SUMF1/EgtB/PvdO family nonheme iron enzyme [Actinomadura pelletieri]RKS73093.1 formylglycine-generating enzyme required for sulfatase activity [Actinomadura pelletieri DSM 43383]
MVLEDDLRERILNVPHISRTTTREALLLRLPRRLAERVPLAETARVFAEKLAQAVVEADRWRHGENVRALEAACHDLSGAPEETSARPSSLSAPMSRYLSTLADELHHVELSHILAQGLVEVQLATVYCRLSCDAAISVRVRDGDIAEWRIRKRTASGSTEEWAAPTLREPALSRLLDRIRDEIFHRRFQRPTERLPVVARPLSADGVLHHYYPLSPLEAASLVDHLIIVGEAGSGKSTVTRYLAYTLAQRALGRPVATRELLSVDRTLVPIYIRIADFTHWAVKQNITRDIGTDHLLDYVAEQFAGDDAIRDALEGALNAGEAWLIFDGLDESRGSAALNANLEERYRRMTRLVNLVAARGSRVLLTSRPFATGEYGQPLFAAGFVSVDLCGMADHEIEFYCRRTLSAIGCRPADVDRHWTQLRRWIDRVDADFKRRALFVTLLCLVEYRHGVANLTASRVDLLRQAYELMVWRWPDNKRSVGGTGKELPYSVNDARLNSALEVVAFETLAHEPSWDTGSDTEDDIDKGRFYRELDVFREQMFEVLEFLIEDSGLLRVVGPKSLRFSFRIIQEFLAATHVADTGRFTELLGLAAEQTGPWAETLSLLAEMLSSDDDRSWVNKLIDAAVTTVREKPDHADSAAWVLGRLLRDEKSARMSAEYAGTVREMLTGVLVSPALNADQRDDVGRALSIVGDRRPGVGVRAGVPDLEWVDVPGGRVRLGLEEEAFAEALRLGGSREFLAPETPSYEISLDGFRISKHPVTAAQYAAFWADEGGASDERWWEAGGWPISSGPPVVPPAERNHPATEVSWYEAMAFARWLSDRLGLQVSLPTEAQWEYAARWGGPAANVPPGDALWCNGHATGLGRPNAVGIFGENGLGAADMIGNVWEWCTSAYTDDSGRVFGYPYDPDDGRESLSLSDTCYRVVRGGSYTNVDFMLRPTVRGHDRPDFRARRQGFRLVCSLAAETTGSVDGTPT